MSKHFFILFFALTGIFAVRAQHATQTLNGKTYYVYPYQQELDIQMRQFRLGVKQEEVIHRDSLNRGIVSTEVIPVKRFVKMTSGKNFNKYKKVFLAIRKDHPGIFINFYLPLEQDIVPVLEPLPDGDYVQFYRDIPYVDQNNVLRYRNDIPAGMFTLKNNRLEGYACWFNSLGDTIKAGHFRDGLKEGAWFANEYAFNTYDEANPKAKITLEKYLDGTYKDTSYVHATYKNGLMDGPYERSNYDFVTETGFYKNGQPSGEWHQYGYRIVREGIKTIYTGKPVLMAHYFLPEKEIVAKSVIVRNSPIDIHQVNRMEFDLAGTYFDPFCRFYKLYELKEEEGLELPEEIPTQARITTKD
jgi:hypothetical protein